MVNKRVFMALALFLLVLGFLNLFSIQYIGIPLSPVVITGHAVSEVGVVGIFIEGAELTIAVLSPENISYDFNKTDSYIIDLNVSANFFVDPVDGWKYSLYDLKHESYVEQNTLFDPNSSITAVRWGNLLTVSALHDGGSWVDKSVVFYISVPNSAPILNPVGDSTLVCEGEQLQYGFNASDIDEDDLIGDISPKNPFYTIYLGRVLNASFYNIVSGILDKSDVGSYIETVSVVDPYEEIDSADINITVIEINNPPVMTGLGAQTVWLEGDNSTFYHQMEVYDVEDGETVDGNLTFNLSWEGGQNFFDIGSSTGIMNYVPQSGQVGVYFLNVCVWDNALDSVHDNISLCAPRSGDAEIVCDNFSLTVTDENRIPEFINYTPNESNFSVSGTVNTLFSVDVYDADGTVPDIDWYVNGLLEKHSENLSSDSISHGLGCGVSGNYSIKVVISDGLLNNSKVWNVSVGLIDCPESLSGGGGGGGGFASYCTENWVCDDWKVCQSVERSFDAKILSWEDYNFYKEICLQKEYDERFCGFQISSCYDLNYCNNVEFRVPRPSEIGTCYFTENPSCEDGITNCHDGACELLVDCGGPCGDCPTCSDKKQNQGEEDVDCGGPCPYVCEPEAPFRVLSGVLTVLSIFLVLIIFYISYKLIILFKLRRTVGETLIRQ